MSISPLASLSSLINPSPFVDSEDQCRELLRREHIVEAFKVSKRISNAETQGEFLVKILDRLLTIPKYREARGVIREIKDPKHKDIALVKLANEAFSRQKLTLTTGYLNQVSNPEKRLGLWKHYVCCCEIKNDRENVQELLGLIKEEEVKNRICKTYFWGYLGGFTDESVTEQEDVANNIDEQKARRWLQNVPPEKKYELITDLLKVFKQNHNLPGARRVWQYVEKYEGISFKFLGLTFYFDLCLTLEQFAEAFELLELSTEINDKQSFLVKALKKVLEHPYEIKSGKISPEKLAEVYQGIKPLLTIAESGNIFDKLIEIYGNEEGCASLFRFRAQLQVSNESRYITDYIVQQLISKKEISKAIQLMYEGEFFAQEDNFTNKLLKTMNLEEVCDKNWDQIISRMKTEEGKDKCLKSLVLFFIKNAHKSEKIEFMVFTFLEKFHSPSGYFPIIGEITSFFLQKRNEEEAIKFARRVPRDENNDNFFFAFLSQISSRSSISFDECLFFCQQVIDKRLKTNALLFLVSKLVQMGTSLERIRQIIRDKCHLPYNDPELEHFYKMTIALKK